MFSIASIDAANIWERALVQLSDDHRKFALNAALDTLPHNANLHLWKKRSNSNCTLCGERQSLIHILNNCPAALRARRYNKRHDLVLEKITSCISSFLQPSEKMTSDLSAYNFPHHITPTTLRPDVVVWDDARKKLLLIELTVCFETMFEDAAQRKQAKYEGCNKILEGLGMQPNTRGAGYATNIITLEVGSVGW